jgi:hypothetical protein
MTKNASGAFWRKVKESFDEKLEEEDDKEDDLPARDATAIENRFKRHIQKDLFYYNKYYKQIKEKKPSGKTEEDIIQDAVDHYLEMEGKPFKFQHCVETLHQMPKFNPMIDDDDDDEARGRG